eukprot:TRINITY_DN7965_c0_g1_i1.p1 TRINITY_DN7965_c0_g1~~TRINITY_DN7965_c0_g1_i1.p1  ORF type:complete len:201 (+),score=18.02 TRINITY_DN7965_c0_g1_i1:63-665(+)
MTEIVQTVPQVELDEEEKAFFDSLKLRKKRKTRLKQASEASSSCETYEDMLSRVYATLRAANPDIDQKQKLLVKVPQVVRTGKKTAFVNFPDFPKALNRPADHLMAFMLSELGTTGNLDGEQHLILQRRFQPKDIEGQVRQYINEYVQCQLCHSLHTNMVKDSNTRLYQMVCTKCSGTRTLPAIHNGYSMKTREQRRAAH